MTVPYVMRTTLPGVHLLRCVYCNINYKVIYDNKTTFYCTIIAQKCTTCYAYVQMLISRRQTQTILQCDKRYFCR